MKYFFSFLFLMAATALQAQDSISIHTANTRLIYPVLWQQTAAEYRALCYQAYNIACERITHLPRKIRRKKNLAIITDIDETVLDNSFFEAQLIKNNRSYTDSLWKQWVSKSAAATVPGAVAFFQLAKARHIQTFYVSNRDTSSEAATLINLKQYGFPDADTAHLLFRQTVSSKESRRQQLMQKYNIVLLCGDNLADFSSLFENKNVDDRLAETDKVKDDWGKKFIVLPNPTYGDWENTFYNNQRGLTEEQKEKVLSELMKGFLL